MKIFKIMLPVIALLAVGTGYANKNDVNNNANKNDVKVAEQHNNEESLDEENRIHYDGKEILPAGTEKDYLVDILSTLYNVIPLYADASTGMWFQVLDQPYREGNYLEATCSAMFTYAWLKGCRLGFLGNREGAVQAYESLLKTFVTEEEDGLVNLNQCCEVAGLGGKENRRGDYEYYINERVRANDPKGIGPLIWAALEYERL